MGTLWSPFFLLASRGEFGRNPRCFGHPIRSNTTSADANTFGLAIHQCSHSLQIGKPTSLGLIIGMTDIVASPGSLATNLADAGHIKRYSNVEFQEKTYDPTSYPCEAVRSRASQTTY